MLLCASGAWAAYYDEGHSGTEQDPYIIRSAGDLQELSTRVNSGTEPGGRYYRLTASLSIEGTETWNPIGAEPHAFTGHFDGSNHTITMNISNPAYRASLFGLIGTSSGYAVKNLKVTGTISGKFAAAIASVIDYGTSASIEGCEFSGTIRAEYQRNPDDSASDNHTSAGGIIEVIQSGTVKNCTVKDAVITANQNRADVSAYAGGIAAAMGGGVIESCTVNAEIGSKGTDSYSGGIVGDSNYGTVTVNRFNGSVNSEGYSGGVAGRMDNGSRDVGDVNVDSNVVAASLASSDITGGKTWGALVGHIMDSIGEIVSNSADITIEGTEDMTNEAIEQLIAPLLSGVGKIEDLTGLPGNLYISGNNINVIIPERIELDGNVDIGSSGCNSFFGLSVIAALAFLRRK